MKKASKENAEKVICRTPTRGKQPTRIDAWKFDLIRKKILKLVPKNGHGVRFMDLPDMIGQLLSDQEKMELGSVGWYTATVKLEMEVAGELKRVEKSSPQRLLRT